MAAVIESKLKTLKLFSAINSSHPFYDQVGNLEQHILNSEAYTAAKKRQQQNLPVSIHAEIKTKSNGIGKLVDRFYYSIQYPDASKHGGWYAWTLYYAEDNPVPVIYEFPHDPKLPHLAQFIHSPEHRNIQVLRYVPLRRVTFIKPGDGQTPTLIGKLKKPKRCLQGYDRLNEINAIAINGHYTIPKAVDIDQEFSTFYQTLMPGQDIAEMFNDQNYLALMADIGQLHARLGNWPIPADQCWDRSGVSLSLGNDIEEIKFYLPESAAFLETIADWLDGCKHDIEPIQGFCHGDFACPQILRDDKSWSVVDFDLAGFGDTYQDMAMFMVSLNYDVPFFKTRPAFLNAAYHAYLNAYFQTTNKPIDKSTLNWYLVCAELYYLALSFKKTYFTQKTYELTRLRLENYIQTGL